MRSFGVLDAPSVPRGGHVCWCFEDRGEFRASAAAFLAEGAVRGERLVYVADDVEERMRADVATITDVDSLERCGGLVLQPVGRIYARRRVLDPRTQVDAYRHLVASALEDGFSGLRVAAEATALVVDDVDRRRFVEYEVAVDRLMSTEPMTAMCLYHTPTIGGAVADVLAVHPLRHDAGNDSNDAGFHCFHDDGALHVTGEIDLTNHDLFEVVLSGVADSGDDEPVIDLGDVTFMDVRSMTHLALLAARLEATGRSLRVERASEIVRRCCDILGFEIPMDELVS